MLAYAHFPTYRPNTTIHAARGFGAGSGGGFSSFVAGTRTGGANDEGAPVALSTQSGHTNRYYCGRHLGRAAIPGSDGQCGPNNGPQCQSCVRFQARPVNPPTLAPFRSTKPPTAGPHFVSTSVTGFDATGFFSAGRGLQSVGCIKSVDLDRKKVQVVVVQGPETLLSQTTPHVGQMVRLSTGYASVGDALLGPLFPGQTAKISHIENDRSVLVQYRVRRYSIDSKALLPQ